MSNQFKNILYSLFLVLVFIAVYLYREYVHDPGLQNKNIKVQEEFLEIRGITMGVVQYNIKYMDPKATNFKNSIDSLLKAFNQALSTYEKDSEISRFNRRDSLVFESPLFYPVLQASQEVFEASEGAFDPSLAELINAWGFGFKQDRLPSEEKIDSLLKNLGFDKIAFNQKRVKKTQAGISLDFSAIAKGYAVDQVADFLLNKGVRNFFVEIGGEVRCQGKNDEGEAWTIGITNPAYKKPNQNRLFASIQLQDESMATSGNYENFYIVDGKKYAHTISPKTGYPIENELLSVSVLTSDCMRADAYATAFMVLGLEKSKEILSQNQNLKAFFIYQNRRREMEVYMSPALEEKTEIF